MLKTTATFIFVLFSGSLANADLPYKIKCANLDGKLLLSGANFHNTTSESASLDYLYIPENSKMGVHTSSEVKGASFMLYASDVTEEGFTTMTNFRGPVTDADHTLRINFTVDVFKQASLTDVGLYLYTKGDPAQSLAWETDAPIWVGGQIMYKYPNGFSMINTNCVILPGL